LRTIEIAQVGPDVTEYLDPSGVLYPAWALEHDDLRLPWEERNRVVLQVEGDDKLSDILDRAASAFRLTENRDWDATRGFFTQRLIALRDDSSPVALRNRLRPAVTLVNDDGMAIWGVDPREVTFAELARAGQSGAVPGDPTQIYLNVIPVPAGGGVLIHWTDIRAMFDAAWQALLVIGALGSLNDAHDLVGKLRGRLMGKTTVENRAEAWIQRNGWPSGMEQTLDGDPKQEREIAALLGCTVDEARGILALYGYSPGVEQGVWAYAAGDATRGIEPSDLAARLVVAYRREAAPLCAGPDPSGDELQALFTRIVEEALSTGRVGLLPHEHHALDMRTEWRSGVTSTDG